MCHHIASISSFGTNMTRLLSNRQGRFLSIPSPEVNMFDPCFVSFKLHYSETKDLAVRDVVRSEVISAGGHSWRVNCYLHGFHAAGKGEYIAIFLELMSKSKGVKAMFEAF